MKPLYNSNTGRTARPRKSCRVLGQMSRELRTELSKMTTAERISLGIKASLCIASLGVDVIGLGIGR